MRYAVLFVGLLLVEVAIALWARGPLRGFVGDTLVVGLVYCFVQALFRLPPARCALGVLLFAWAIELLQAVDYARWLGADSHPWLSVALGRTFSWADFLAYALGALLIVAVEKASAPGGKRG